jgi:hypothetical protein
MDGWSSAGPRPRRQRPHPDPEVVADALGPLAHDHGILRLINTDLLADNNFLREKDIGTGDDVAFIGLFSESPGDERNRPIVRLGNVARMNEELSPQEYQSGQMTWIDAILVEARSWGGHSGSPALVLFPVNRQPGTLVIPQYPTDPFPPDDPDERAAWEAAMAKRPPREDFALLGLVVGHGTWVPRFGRRISRLKVWRFYA